MSMQIVHGKWQVASTGHQACRDMLYTFLERSRLSWDPAPSSLKGQLTTTSQSDTVSTPVDDTLMRTLVPSGSTLALCASFCGSGCHQTGDLLCAFALRTVVYSTRATRAARTRTRAAKAARTGAARAARTRISCGAYIATTRT